MKIFRYAIALILINFLFMSCDTKKKDSAENKQNTETIDSLNRIIVQKDNEIQDMLTTINEIQTGFRLISQAEGRLSLNKTGEGANLQEQIQNDINFISHQMKRNRELIEKLQKQAREGSVAAEQLHKTIEGLTAELSDKNKQLETLRAELSAKDLRINELDETVSSLNNDVAVLKTESQQLNNTISSQDKQLNTAWYAFGTKKELTNNRILEKGRVLQSNFNKSYFTKVDIRIDKEIKLYSKSAKILTSHPSSSYSLIQDASKQYVLRITNPEQFWSTSKYLVVEVK